MKIFFARITRHILAPLLGSALVGGLIPSCGVSGGYSVGGAVGRYTFIHVANYGNSTVAAFYLKSDGTLVQSAGILPTGTGTSSPSGLALSPDSKTLYAAMFNSSNVAAYSIDDMSAEYPSVLTALSGTNTFSAGSGTAGIAMAPSGRYLYTTSYSAASNNVLAFSVNASTAALTAIGTASAKVNPSSIALPPQGTYAYITNQGTSNVSAFAISSATGLLSAVAGSPFNSQSSPIHSAIDRTGNVLLVVNNGSNTVTTYTIDSSTGALTTVGHTATGAGPVRVAVHPSNSYVYVTNNTDNNISGYALNAVTGVLTPLSGSPFTLSGETAPWAMAFDPDGAYLIVSWITSGYVSVFSVDAATGALTSVGTPQPVGVMPRAIVSFQLTQDE